MHKYIYKIKIYTVFDVVLSPKRPTLSKIRDEGLDNGYFPKFSNILQLLDQKCNLRVVWLLLHRI